jgi:hypothetical protein
MTGRVEGKVAFVAIPPGFTRTLGAGQAAGRRRAA